MLQEPADELAGVNAHDLDTAWTRLHINRLGVYNVGMSGEGLGLFIDGAFVSQLLQTEQFQCHAHSHTAGTTALHLSKDGPAHLSGMHFSITTSRKI